ncbi:MAG: helix-turn-helix domain-containing protein [Clostridium sp.]|nr:helix-turn-helix domain-containing protein [Clostridium sp.]
MKYYKLADLLNRRGMKKKDLLDVISEPTLAKLFSGKSVSTNVLSAVCCKLNCDISDIAEYIYDEKDGHKQIVKRRNEV